MLKRRELATLAGWLAAGCAARADDAARPASGFAFVSPEAAQALEHAPRSETAAAILRAAERAANRPSHAMARVHVEGTLPHQGIYDESLEALRDLPAARDLALAGRLSGSTRFTEAAARLAGSWAATYTPSFNPIDETGFDALFIAWDVLPPSARAPHEAAMSRLLYGFAEGYPRQVLRGQTATNNWNSHRVKIAALAAFATGNATLIAQARAKFAAQIEANIDASGVTLDFGLRDALHYVVYDLEPLLMSVLAARRHGQDWYGDSGGRLGKALAWLRPFATGEKQHEEFAHTSIAFDITRRNAGIKGFDGAFQPAVARMLYGMAARIDLAYLPLARALRAAAWEDAWLEALWPRAP
jgi:hypothetical protein